MKISKTLIVTLFITIISLLTIPEAAAANKGKRHKVKAEKFLKIAAEPDVQILDVRSKTAYHRGHILRARCIDVDNPLFEELAVRVLDPQRPVAVYCTVGSRSKRAAKILTNNGFTVYELKGGIKGVNTMLVESSGIVIE